MPVFHTPEAEDMAILLDEAEREGLYDEILFPLIKYLGQVCEKQTMNMVMGIEFNPGKIGAVSGLLTGEAPPPMILAGASLTGQLTFDQFFVETVEYARKNGHNSDILEALGIPKTPIDKP